MDEIEFLQYIFFDPNEFLCQIRQFGAEIEQIRKSFIKTD